MMNVVLFIQSIEGIISASKEDLVLCPGLGPQKVSKNTSAPCEYTDKQQTCFNLQCWHFVLAGEATL